jgi:hypothetical protein
MDQIQKCNYLEMICFLVYIHTIALAIALVGGFVVVSTIEQQMQADKGAIPNSHSGIHGRDLFILEI